MKKSIFRLIIPSILALVMVFQCVPVFAISENEISGIVEFSIADATGKPRDTIEVLISVSSETEVTGLILHNLTYDEKALEFVEYKSYGALIEESLLKGEESISGSDISLGYITNIVPNGEICIAVFKIKDNAEDGKYSISFSTVSASKDRKEVQSSLKSGTITVSRWAVGNFDQDEYDTVDMMDVVYFMNWVNFPFKYTMVYDGNKDFNNSGNIDMEDVRCFMNWVNFPMLDKFAIDWYGEARCAHVLEKADAKAPTCTEGGNIEYWHCTKCGKYFADEAGSNEISLESTVLSATGHSYAKAWSSNANYHWHSATCGHTDMADYGKHDFDENNVCTVCGYTNQENYYDEYQKYAQIGKTVNLITASDYYTPMSGQDGLFTDDLYKIRLNIYDVGKQPTDSMSFNTFEQFANHFQASVDAKISFGSRKKSNGHFMTNKLPSLSFSGSYAYEHKKASETSEYIYYWYYVLNGKIVEISGYNNKDKLASVLSPEFIADARKVRSGEMSAEAFTTLWGTHVFTSGIYGARLDATYYEVSHSTDDYSSHKASLDATLEYRFAKTGLNAVAGLDVSNIKTSVEKDAFKHLTINGTAKNTFSATSFDELASSYKTWQSNFESDIEGNSVLIDVPDGSLCCIWYLLDDSFDDVKEILDDYMYSQCSDLYEQYVSKINGLKLKDDVTFDKETGTLEINFATYQKQGNLSGFKSDSYVRYNELEQVKAYDKTRKHGIIEITPYYNNEQVKRIVINGAYGMFDSAGQKIDKALETSIKLLQGDWYDELEIQLSNVAIAGSEDYSAIDFTAVKNSNPLTVICIGNNKIVGHRAFGSKKAQAALVANSIVLKSNSTTDSLTLYGGFGRFKEWDSDKGGDGASALIANNITADMAGTLSAYGGDGGKGADGTNGTDGTGENGGKGVNGGAGNYAVRSESQIVVKNGTVNLHGGASGSSGRGGNGGKGTTGTKNGWMWGKGGTGGTGGRGGDSGDVMQGSPATNCGYIISDNCTATVYCEIGKTGNVGEPGKGGAGGDGGSDGGWVGASYGDPGSPGSDGSYGRVLYDVTTAGVYNNADNGNVTHSIENGMLKITVSGEAAPGLGGFVQSTSSAPYKVFYHTIVAKVPVGYKLEHASNAIGDGAHFEWMTSNSGTGEFETYVYRTTCGSTGTFNDFGYVYLYADDYTTVIYPVEWYVSYANITE